MKEGSTESSETAVKKRKTAISTTGTTTYPIKSEELYDAVCKFEENESEKRDPDNDFQLFRKTCDKLRVFMQEIAELKNVKTDEAQVAINEKKTQASLFFVLIKKLNRLEKLRMKKSRDDLHKVKQQVDSQHLQLQNLLYEVLHLQKEVKKCLQFKSEDDEIDLVPMEQFLEEAPKSLTQKESIKEDAHQLQKARLEWELQQRRSLAEACEGLHAQKASVARDIEKEQQHLENLAPMLRSILEHTKPVQESLGITLDETRKQHQLAYLLPQPLFFLYSQADALQQSSALLKHVSICGDEDEARRLKMNLSEGNEEEESESETEEIGDRGGRMKRHHRKNTKIDRQQERNKRLLLQHPLTVNLTISLPDKNGMDVVFTYLLTLDVVTVKCQVNLSEAIEGIYASQLVSPDVILRSLYPGDVGVDSPNPANRNQLESVGLGPFSSLVSSLGNPYIWAQRAAGLDFLQVNPNKQKTNKALVPTLALSMSSIPSIVKAVYNRFKSRLALCKQIQLLETCTIPALTNLKGLFPLKCSTTLNKWQQITWEEYRLEPCSQNLIELQQVAPEDFFYRAHFVRSSVRLVAYIAVKSDYPVFPPVFSLQLHCSDERIAADSDALRDMEREVNVYYSELTVGRGWAHTLLAAQVMRLMVCLDVFLESKGPASQFPKDKVFLQPVRDITRFAELYMIGSVCEACDFTKLFDALLKANGRSQNPQSIANIPFLKQIARLIPTLVQIPNNQSRCFVSIK